MKKFLFLFIVFFSFSVFAEEVDVTGNCYGSTGYARMYSGDEVEYQTYSNYNFGTTYQKQLSSFETELRYSFSANTQYTLTFNTNGGNDFRNNFRTWSVYDLDNNDNDLVNSFTFITMKKIQITFTTTSATTKVKVQFGGSNVYDNITGETNWNIKNAILTIPNSGSGGSTNQDIINNNNDNTNNIIDNANQNTSILNDSINSACKDTTITIDSDLSMKSAYYLDNTGSEVQYNGAYISKYIKIKPGSTYTITRTTGGSQPNDVGYCRYNANKSKYQCASMPGENSSITFTANNYDAYLRVSFIGYRLVQVKGPICNNWEQEAQQDTINSIKENAQATQDTINNNFNNCDPKLIDSYVRSDAVINNSYLASNGQVAGSGSNIGISDYISISANTDYSIRQSSASINLGSFCLYTTSKSLIRCTTFSNNLTREFNSGSAAYLRTSLSSSATISLYKVSCSNRIDDVNDTLNNSNVDNGTGSDFFDNFTSQDFGLSDIITIPLNTIQSLTSKTCVPLQVPIPFTNSNISLPCMSEIYSSKFPSIYNLWQIVSFGIISYFIAIDIFRIVKGFKDPESDKVEVLDL